MSTFDDEVPGIAHLYLATVVTIDEDGQSVPAATSSMVRNGPVHVITAWNPGDERMTVGVVLVGMWVVPWLIRKIRGSRAPVPASAPAPVSAVVDATPSVAAQPAGTKRGGSRARGRKRAKYATGASR